MLTAFPVLGLFSVFVYPTIIPELIERLVVELKIEEGKDEYVDMMLNDKCTECFGFVFALTTFMAPLIGSHMYTSYGAKFTTDTVAVINFFLGVILL